MIRIARGLFLTGLSAVTIISSGLVGAQERIEYIDSLLWSKAYDIALDGDFAYCAFLNGLLILDISDPHDPVFVSRLYLGGGNAITLVDDLVYVAAGAEGLAVIDVSDVRRPREIGRFPTSGEARDIAVIDGTRAIIAAGEAGVQIVDISHSQSPRPVSRIDTPGSAGAIAVRGDMICVADGAMGIHLIDLRIPSTPTLLGSVDTPGTAERIALSGEHAWVTDGPAGLVGIDISDPANPRLGASFAASGYARGITITENRAYLGNIYDGGFQIVDISDPAAPKEVKVTKYTMYNEAWDAVVRDELAYVVDYFSGIHIMPVAEEGRTRVSGRFITPGSIIAAEAVGSRVCAVGDLSGLKVIDFSDPDHPRMTATTDVFRGVHGLAADGDRAFVTDRWAVQVYDIATVGEIEMIGRLPIPGVARSPVARGDYLYLTADLTGFHVISLADPTEPAIIGSFEMPGFAYGLDVEGNHAFIANSDTGFHILDISDPHAPEQVGFTETPGLIYGVDVEEGIAWVADGPGGLQVIDISDPRAPAIMGSCAFDGFISDVKVANGIAWLSDESYGLRMVDVSDPRAPRLVDSYSTPGEPASVALCGDRVILLDSYSMIVFKRE